MFKALEAQHVCLLHLNASRSASGPTAQVVIMFIVDSQIHLWAGPGSSTWHGSTPFLAEDALAGMDAAGVEAAVIHPQGGIPAPPPTWPRSP
jgi:hypothetical protein